MKPRAIYVNLPVKDLRRSMAFFESMGFSFDRRFTNEQAAALVVSDTIFAMLHTHESFRRFTGKDICDAHGTTEVMLALQLENREAVRDFAAKMVAAGGREYRPAQDHGFMYEQAMEDLDGHIWEAFWMDPDAVPQP